MITKFTIFGERCSGTNFLEHAIIENFGLQLTSKYGWKHFFGFDKYDTPDCDQTLFIGIVRNPYKWMNSFYKNPHHLHDGLKRNPESFFTQEFWSFHSTKEKHGQEIMEDRNINTKRRYKNIFESRQVKCRYLLNEMPKKVKYYILIKYEDLRDRYDQTMDRIMGISADLKKKHDKYVRIDSYKGETKQPFTINEQEVLNRKRISSNLNVELEKRLGYQVDTVVKPPVPVTKIVKTPIKIAVFNPPIGHYS